MDNNTPISVMDRNSTVTAENPHMKDIIIGALSRLYELPEMKTVIDEMKY